VALVESFHQADASESTVRDFFKLLKPGVMSLVVFSGLAGMWVAPTTIHPFLALVALLCIALGSGASGAINMWYDRDIDAIMRRTQNRPIPAGKIAPDTALAFGVIGALGSVIVMAVALNLVAAFWLLTAILFYVFIYTMGLKRRTPHNIVIGGAAGAFPPVIGWAAVMGNTGLYPWLLFLIIFLWTPPHFWALALYRNDDYRKANIPMLPVVSGAKTTKRHMLFYTILMIASTLAPWVLDYSGAIYGVGAAILSAVFLWHNIKVIRSDDDKIAMKMFGFSILYLFALFALLMVDHSIR
jgi:protoheme IX farnesyltransferase